MQRSSSSIDLTARERAVLALMDAWPWATGRGVLIGGYAVSAYGSPRYSIDVDVVIPASTTYEIRSWLRRTGFVRSAHAVPNPQNYAGQVERYTSKEVTLDLLSGAVRDREALVDVPEEWIARAPRRMILETLSGRTSQSIPIARPEALWVLKLQSGRDLDLADLFVLSDQPTDFNDVRELFRRLATDSLRSKLLAVGAKLADHRLFEDSLSRRGLGSPKSPKNIRRWQRFAALVESAIPATFHRR